MFCTQIFPTKAFETFPDALEAVSQEEVFQTNTPSAAAFACAGPVANNKCEMTNLDWTIDGDYLSATHGIRYVISTVRSFGWSQKCFCSDGHIPTTDVIASSRHVFLLLSSAAGASRSKCQA